MKKIFLKKADIILILVLFLISALLFLAVYVFNSNTGSFVTVEVNGEVTETISLDENGKYSIDGANGGKNILIIKDGYAKMEEATCKDKICVNHKKINKVGESIICLPNKVVVSVTSSTENEEIDGVA